MPETNKTPCVRAIIPPDFLDYLEFYHSTIVQRLHNTYPCTLLPQGLEIERPSLEDETLLVNLYKDFVKSYTKTLHDPESPTI
jgi:hypothetical protein